METGLKQEDTLSPVLFNLTLKKVVRLLKDNECGISINWNEIRPLGLADDLDIIVDSFAGTANTARVLGKPAKRAGLEINADETKTMDLIGSENDADEMEDFNYEKISGFKCLEATLSTKNDWS